MLRMELIILNALHFDLTVSTVADFLTLFLFTTQLDNPRIVAHAKYVAEMLLPFYSVQHMWSPSQLAAAIICFSRGCYGSPVWPSKYEKITGYTMKQLRQLVVQLHDIYQQVAPAPTGTLTAAREKYRQPKYFCVADAPLPSLVLF